MLSILNQTKSHHSASYQLQGSQPFFAEVPFSPGSVSAHVFRGSEELCAIASDLPGSFQKRNLVPNGKCIKPFLILDPMGRSAGSIMKVRVGTLFSSTYRYELFIQGQTYTIYEVGLGERGIAYPIYGPNDKQIAQVDKDPEVRDNLDQYTICSMDPNSEFIAFLFALYLDVTQFRHCGQKAAGARSVHYLWTRNPEILSRLDPNFYSACAGDMAPFPVIRLSV